MESTVVLKNEDGLHARPAGVFAKKAGEFSSVIEIRANGLTKNAKSIMGLMSLGLEQGAQVTIVAKGNDEADAVKALVELIETRFGTA